MHYCCGNRAHHNSANSTDGSLSGQKNPIPNGLDSRNYCRAVSRNQKIQFKLLHDGFSLHPETTPYHHQTNCYARAKGKRCNVRRLTLHSLRPVSRTTENVRDLVFLSSQAKSSWEFEHQFSTREAIKLIYFSSA